MTPPARVTITPLIAEAPVTAAPEPETVQEAAVRIALSDVGVREQGDNDGPEVRSFLASVGLGPHYKWCGAWMHSVYRRAGLVLEPARSFAMAATWADSHIVMRKGGLDAFDESNVSDIERISEDGDAFTLHYASLKRVGHVGMVIGEDDDSFITVEGNTGPGGEREGQGVYKRIRDKEIIWTLNRWIP